MKEFVIILTNGKELCLTGETFEFSQGVSPVSWCLFRDNKRVAYFSPNHVIGYYEKTAEPVDPKQGDVSR